MGSLMDLSAGGEGWVRRRWGRRVARAAGHRPQVLVGGERKLVFIPHMCQRRTGCLHRMDRCSACNIVGWRSTFHTEHVTQQFCEA